MSAAREELRKAFEAFSRGSLEESSRLCELALERDGRDAGALHLASAIALLQGRLDVALARVDAAIRSSPGDARQYQTRGQAHLALGSTASAESDFRKAIELDPDFPDSHASLGARLFEHGQYEDAHAHLARALKKRPDAAQWRYNLALCESRLGHGEAAERNLSEVLRLRPDWPLALNELGALLIRRGEYAAAARKLEAAVRLDPVLNAGWNNLGIALLSGGDLEGARRSLARALELDPSNAEAWANLGNVERREGDRAAAERAYRTALEHQPGLFDAFQNLGNIQREQGHLVESKATLERCVAAFDRPDVHFSLALTLLTMDELERGWAEYRWRDGATPGAAEQDALRAALETHRPIELMGEQGLGDVMFFLRWVPMLSANPESLSLRCDPRLHAIAAATGHFGRLVGEDSPKSSGVLSIRIGDLPALVGRRAAAHPPPVPLKADPAALGAARDALRDAGPPPYVAVAWRAGLPAGASEERLFKAVPLERLGSALQDVPGTFVSVQRNPEAGEIEALASRIGRSVLDASAFNDDISRITGMMAAVDSYVGVSSTNVHIRAGLGLGAQILVPFPPEWRYGGSGGSTPWYPNFHLHREHASQGWDAALEDLVATRAGRGS